MKSLSFDIRFWVVGIRHVRSALQCNLPLKDECLIIRYIYILDIHVWVEDSALDFVRHIFTVKRILNVLEGIVTLYFPEATVSGQLLSRSLRNVLVLVSARDSADEFFNCVCTTAVYFLRERLWEVLDLGPCQDFEAP